MMQTHFKLILKLLFRKEIWNFVQKYLTDRQTKKFCEEGNRTLPSKISRLLSFLKILENHFQIGGKNVFLDKFWHLNFVKTIDPYPT